MFTLPQDQASTAPIGMLISGDAALSSPTLLAERARTKVADLMEQQPVILASMESSTGPALQYHGTFDGAVFATYDRSRLTEALAMAVINEQLGTSNIRVGVFPDRAVIDGVSAISDHFAGLVQGAVASNPEPVPTVVAQPLADFMTTRIAEVVASVDDSPGALLKAWRDRVAHAVGELLQLAAQDGSGAVQREFADVVRVANYYAQVNAT